MAQPPAYNRTHDFTLDEKGDVDTASLNAEYDNVALAVNKIRECLALLQNDDGTLKADTIRGGAIAKELMKSIDELIAAALQAAQKASDMANKATEEATNAKDSIEESGDEWVLALRKEGKTQTENVAEAGDAQSGRLETETTESINKLIQVSETEIKKAEEQAANAATSAATSKEYANKLLAFKDQILTVSGNIKSVGVTAENAEAIAAIAKNLEELLKSKDYAAEAKGWAEKAKAITGEQALIMPGGTSSLPVLDWIAAKPHVFKSVADMKAAKFLAPGMTAVTQGYYEPGDGGGAVFLVRKMTGEDTDNGGTLHTLQGTLCAAMVLDGGAICPEQFGARADGVTDDTALIEAAGQCAIQLNKCLYATKTYYCASDLNLRYLTRIYISGQIILADEKYLIIGHSSAKPKYCDLIVANATRVKVVGLKNSKVTVGVTQELLLWADGDVSDDSSIAYNAFNGSYANSIILNSNPSASGLGWINENTFNIRHGKHISIDGNYQHNGNSFPDICLEGNDATINIANGNFNKILCRAESIDYDNNVNITGDSYANEILTKYRGSIVDFFTAVQVDNSKLLSLNKKNSVRLAYRSVRTTLARIDSSHVPFLNGACYRKSSIGMYGTPWSKPIISGYIPTEGKITAVGVLADAPLFRLNVWLYDENHNLIHPSTANVVAAGGTYTANYLTWSVDKSDMLAVILGYNGVAFYRAEAWVGGKGGDFGYLTMFAYTQTQANAPLPIEIKSTATAIPTVGAWNVGEIVWNSAPVSGKAIGWVCTKSGDFSDSANLPTFIQFL